MGVLADEQALARTYSHPSVADTWDLVEQYRAAMRYDPTAGSTAVARAVDAPRGRVRGWLDGAKPDAIHAIEVADDHGWLAEEWTPTTEALAHLVALVFATGTIRRDAWVPSWTPSAEVTREQLRTDLDTVGVGWRLAHEDSVHQTTEIRPTEHASVLGRVLAVAGAPVGPKHEVVTALPEWLADAPVTVRADWAAWYVRERGIGQPDKATRQIQADRPQRFYEQLGELLRDVTGEAVTVSEGRLVVSAAAVRALGVV